MFESWLLLILLLIAAWFGNELLTGNDLLDLKDSLVGNWEARGLIGVFAVELGWLCKSLSLTVNAAGNTPIRPWHSPYSHPSSVLTERSTLIMSPIWMLSSSSRLASNAYWALNLTELRSTWIKSYFYLFCFF